MGVEDPKGVELSEIIQEPLKDVYTIPLFSEKFCEILLNEVKNMEQHALRPTQRKTIKTDAMKLF